MNDIKEEYEMCFGNAIRTYRQNRRLTQLELAKKSKITSVYLSMLENGKRGASLRTLTKIAAALEVSIDVLIWDALEIPEELSQEDRAICRRAKSIMKELHWK